MPVWPKKSGESSSRLGKNMKTVSSVQKKKPPSTSKTSNRKEINKGNQLHKGRVRSLRSAMPLWPKKSGELSCRQEKNMKTVSSVQKKKPPCTSKTSNRKEITRAKQLRKGSARSLRSAMPVWPKKSGESSSRLGKNMKTVSSVQKKKPPSTSKTSNRKEINKGNQLHKGRVRSLRSAMPLWPKKSGELSCRQEKNMKTVSSVQKKKPPCTSKTSNRKEITRAKQLRKGSARSLRSAMPVWPKKSGESSSRLGKNMKTVSSVQKKKPPSTSKTSNRKEINKGNQLHKGRVRSLRSAMPLWPKKSGELSCRQEKNMKTVSSVQKKKPPCTSKTSNRKDASPALSPSVNVFKPPTVHSLTNGAADLEAIHSTCDALPPVHVPSTNKAKDSTAGTKKTPYCSPPGYFPHARYNEGNILCYEDLPDDCTENDLYNLFSRLGELKECAIFMKRGYVEMKTPQEAVKADKNLYKFAQDINYLASDTDSVPLVEASSDENYDKEKEKSHLCEGLILDDATVAAEPRMSMNSNVHYINLEHVNAQQEPSSTSTGDYETGITDGSTSPKPSCSKNLSENYSDEESQ